MSDAEEVYEFGCGSGYNLVALAQRYPQIQLTGLDWVESAVELVNRVGRAHDLRLQGRRFDFFNPDSSISFGPRSVAVTMAALEQVGSGYGKFLEFLLQKRPSLVVNLEPLYELYDPTNLVDYLAMRYHKTRGYLDGYLSCLRKLEAEKRIEIIHTHRPCFGSLFHEGYSLVVWRPLKG
jgi:SAM-dependent methyltransferase